MNHGSHRRRTSPSRRERSDAERDGRHNRHRDRRHRSRSRDRSVDRKRRTGRKDRHSERSRERGSEGRGRPECSSKDRAIRSGRSGSRDRKKKRLGSEESAKCEETGISVRTECRRSDPGNEIPECIGQSLTIGTSLLSAPSTSSSRVSAPAEIPIDKRQVQEQKRKQLWTADSALPSKSSVWQGLQFSSDSQTEKFRKLMGIKEAPPQPKSSSDQSASDRETGLQRRQEQLFRDLDQQYAAARSVTHTQRGTGLGFGS